MRIIDAHHHFWQVSRDDYGWLTPELTALFHDFGPEDLEALNKRSGIAETIVVQAAETEAETDFLLGIAARSDFVAGVVGWLDMASDRFEDRLDHYVAQPKWVGLRPMLQEHDPSQIGTLAFRSALSIVAKRDVPFDILTFPSHLPAMIEAVEQTPDLRGIIDHISKPDMTQTDLGVWANDMARLAAHPRLMCKISGLITEAGENWTADLIRPYLRHVAKVFGPDRLVFGTDWPVCNLAGSHAQVVGLAKYLLGEIYGSEDLQKIFANNAIRFYKLRPEP